MDEINIYASSTDSPKIYPDNNPNYFTIELPEQINLSSKWLISLTEMYIADTINQPFYIYSDICRPSINNEKMEPLLKVIYPDCIHFSSLTYVPINTSYFKRLRIYIKGGESRTDSILTKIVHVSLHLMKKYE